MTLQKEFEQPPSNKKQKCVCWIARKIYVALNNFNKRITENVFKCFSIMLRNLNKNDAFSMNYSNICRL